MSLFTPRLLITDDDRDFRETVAGVLADRGFETLQAGDGEEALRIVCRHEVHLILLDMQMPRLNGLDTIERIRGVGWDQLASASAGAPESSPQFAGQSQLAFDRPTLRFPPWILISGALDDQIVARARAASVFSVLPKPLRLPDLTGAVANALEQAYGWRAA
jgi:CheY-like chemotaxis protein